ncbi:MAG: hypothetical protein ACJ74W_02490 [Pyrinomonadaceae bacterium]
MPGSFWWQRIYDSSARLRRWLRTNFYLPGLRPRWLLFAGVAEAPAPTESAVTDERVPRAGRDLRLLSSAPMRIDQSYAQWLATLTELAPGRTVAEFQRAATQPTGGSAAAPIFFPLETYLSALADSTDRAADFAHYLTASRQPALDFALTLIGQKSAATELTSAPVSLLLYNFAAHPARQR